MGIGVENRWITGRHGVGAPRIRVICVPQSGGGAGAFSSWRGHVPEGVELAPVELPARGTRSREPMPVGFDALADALYEGLRPEFDLPYVLFGHSFGGMLAYEVARRAERDGVRPPLAALVSGTRAPHVAQRWSVSEADEETLLGWMSANGGLPSELFEYPAFLKEVLRVVRMDLGYAERYFDAEPARLAVPLHVFGGTGDTVTPPEALPHWERCAGGEFSVTMLPGDHSFPHTGPAAIMDVISRIAGLGAAAA